jgi:hypothetical protein
MVHRKLDSVRFCWAAGLHRACKRRQGTRQVNSVEKRFSDYNAEWFRLDASKYEEVKALSITNRATHYRNCSFSRCHFLRAILERLKVPQINKVWWNEHDNRMGYLLLYLKKLI